MKGCTIKDLADYFRLKTLFSTPESDMKPVTVIEVDRPGLELAGFFDYHQKSRLVLIGKKEIAYLGHMPDSKIYQAFRQICSEETPGVIFCHGVICPDAAKKAALEQGCSIYATETETSAFEADALNYLCEQLAPRTSVHANLLEIFGEGVLLLGASGIGKSEVSLDLIKRGHTLVADDKVDILNVRDHLEGSSPSLIYGMMEVRGIGIIDVPRLFGINSLTRKTMIKYCIELRQADPAESLDRIGNKNERINFLGIDIPLVRLPVSPGRSMAEVIEVAVTNFKLREYGIDVASEFDKKLSRQRQLAASELKSSEGNDK